MIPDSLSNDVEPPPETFITFNLEDHDFIRANKRLRKNCKCLIMTIIYGFLLIPHTNKMCVRFTTSTRYDFLQTSANWTLKANSHQAIANAKSLLRWVLRESNVLFTLGSCKNESKILLSCSPHLSMNRP